MIFNKYDSLFDTYILYFCIKLVLIIILNNNSACTLLFTFFCVLTVAWFSTTTDVFRRIRCSRCVLLNWLFCLITGPPNGQVLFCSLASVVVCNAAGGRAGRRAGRRARGRSGGQHCTAIMGIPCFKSSDVLYVTPISWTSQSCN